MVVGKTLLALDLRGNNFPRSFVKSVSRASFKNAS